MTLNLSLVTDDFAICVTDRRLSAPVGGIVSERGNKLTVFECRNARGFITYCGVGRDGNGQSPNDWIADNPLLPSMTLDEFLKAIKNISDGRLRSLAVKGYDARHTFVVGGFVDGAPVLAMISNYESLASEDVRDVADPELSIDFRMPSPDAKRPVIIGATGDIPFDRKSSVAKIGGLAKGGLPPPTLVARMTKLIRDVAYAADRKGSVGTSVNRVIVPRFGPAEIGADVVGGTSLLEPPNMISPGMMVRDVYIDVGGNVSGSRYSGVHRKAIFRERRCPNCGTPVPEGYRQCGKCDAPVSA